MGIVSFGNYSFGGDYQILSGNEKESFCDGKTHPVKGFKPYRRGFGRCLTCGAKKGFKMDWKAYNLPIGNSNINTEERDNV